MIIFNPSTCIPNFSPASPTKANDDLNTSISDFTAVCSRSEILLEANGSLVSPCAQEKQAPKIAQMIPLPFPSLNEPSSSEESDFAPVAGSAARLLAQDISSSLPWWTGALGFLSCRVPSSSLPARISRAWLQCSHSTPASIPPPSAGAVVADCVHGESLWNRFGAASSIPSRSSSCVLPYNFRIIIASVHVNITSQFPLILPPAIFPHTNLM